MFTEFEVARDIVTMMKSMGLDETLVLRIHSDSVVHLFSWESDKSNQPCGPGEAATGMRKAYDKIFKN